MDTANQPSLDRAFYLVIDGEQKGPFSLEELRALQSSGAVTNQTLYWREGMADWLALGQSAEFQNSGKPRQVPIPPSGGSSPTPYRSEKVGFILLAAPVMASLLIWILGNSPIIGVAMVIGTAVLIAIDAKNLGMGSPTDLTPKNKREMGPIHWSACTLFLWVIGFPAYLYKRSRYHARGLLLPGICTVLIFFASAALAPVGVADVPSVESPEVIQQVEQILKNQLQGFQVSPQVKIQSPVEIKYDKKEKKRYARALLDSEVIYYTVQWHDPAKGTFLVEVATNLAALK